MCASRRFTAVKRDTAFVALASAAIVAALAQLIDFGYGRDQGIYAAVARTIRAGGVPYRDAWDFKPPGIFFLYALAGTLFGDSVHAIRWLEAIAVCSVVVAFVYLSIEYMGDWRPGVVGGVLAVVEYVQLEFWHTGQPESFGAALVSWGLLLGVRATSRDGDEPRRSWSAMAVGAGACAGCAFLLKPTIAVAALASLVVVVLAQGIPAVIPFLAGAALPLGACGVFFRVRGGLEDLRHTLFDFVPRYAALAWQDHAVSDVVMRGIRVWLFGFPIVNVVGLGLLVALMPNARVRHGGLFLGGAILLLLLGVFIQGRLFPYHYGTLLPLTALLAGWGIWLLWLRIGRSQTGMLVLPILVALLLFWRSERPDLPDSFLQRCRMRVTSWINAASTNEVRDRLYSVLDYRARDNRIAASRLAEETTSEDHVLVYGFAPEVYVAAGRRPATRYLYSVPMRAPWSKDEARITIMNDLDRTQPAAILVQHGDLVPEVTGVIGDSAADLHDFSALRTLIAERYTREPPAGQFDVYRRRK